MSTFYEDNMNIKKINGFTLQQVSRDVWAIDEYRCRSISRVR